MNSPDALAFLITNFITQRTHSRSLKEKLGLDGIAE